MSRDSYKKEGVLSDSEVIDRANRVNSEKLCFISLKPLDGSEVKKLITKGAISVEVGVLPQYIHTTA